MSSRSLNEILIKIPTELFDFIFAVYNLRFILPLVVYICVQRDDAHRIQQHCFIYRSISAIPALRKRRVQGHCAVYQFRIGYNVMSSWKGRGNQYIQLVKVLNCKLHGKQLSHMRLGRDSNYAEVGGKCATTAPPWFLCRSITSKTPQKHVIFLKTGSTWI